MWGAAGDLGCDGAGGWGRPGGLRGKEDGDPRDGERKSRRGEFGDHTHSCTRVVCPLIPPPPALSPPEDKAEQPPHFPRTPSQIFPCVSPGGRSPEQLHLRGADGVEQSAELTWPWAGRSPAGVQECVCAGGRGRAAWGRGGVGTGEGWERLGGGHAAPQRGPGGDVWGAGTFARVARGAHAGVQAHARSTRLGGVGTGCAHRYGGV